MSGSVGAPNPDFGNMTARSRLGGVSNPGFGGSESEKLLGGGGVAPRSRSFGVKIRDKGVFWNPHPSKLDLVRQTQEEIATLHKL